MSGFTTARANKLSLSRPRMAYKGSEILGDDGTYLEFRYIGIKNQFCGTLAKIHWQKVKWHFG